MVASNSVARTCFDLGFGFWVSFVESFVIGSDMDLPSLVVVLQAALSPNPDERKAAEQSLNQVHDHCFTDHWDGFRLIGIGFWKF